MTGNNHAKFKQTQTNLVANKLIERENLWIKSHIRLIKIKSHFSGFHFDDKFPTFGVAAYIGFVKFLIEIILGFSYGVKSV